MNSVVRCAQCKEQIEGEPVVRPGKVYCSEACAFEATKRTAPTLCGHDNNGAAAAAMRQRTGETATRRGS